MCTTRMTMIILLVGVGMVISLATPTGLALAQEPEPYTGIDFVFLIDQSGSMCGAACKSTIETRNDPQGFRFEGPRFAIIDFLGDQMSEIYVSSTARISIIEFGQDVNLDEYRAGEDIEYANTAINEVLPVTTIESDRNAWRGQREQLLQQLTAYQALRETQNLGNTDHLGAVKRAFEVLNQMQASDSSKRLKVIVLLTDGQSAICYPRGPQEDPWADERCLGPGQILPQVESEVQANLAGEDYRFYVVGMQDKASNYWTNNGPLWEKLAGEHHGEARLVESENEVAQFMGEIVSAALAGLSLPPDRPGVFTEWLPQLGYFSVRPYLQSLTFYVIRTTPTDQINIYNPEGNPLDFGLADGECQNDICFYKLGRLIDKIVVARPEPGTWRAEATLPNTENVYETVRIGMRSLLFAPQLLKPTGGRYAEGVPIEIQFAMLDLDGKTVPRYEDPVYSLNSIASLVDGGQQKVAEASLDPVTFSGTLIPSKAGDAFEIHLIGTTHTPDGEEFQVLDQIIQGGFSIERLTGEFIPPEGPLQNREATLSYNLNLENFQLPTDGYRYTGQFELTHPDIATPVIVPAGDEDGDGVFSANYKPELEGTYRVEFKLFLTDEASGQQTPVPTDSTQDGSREFVVEPTKGLELVLIEPADGSQQVTRNWLLQTAPMDIKVALRNTSTGEFVNWADVRADNAATTIPIEIQDPQGQLRGSQLQIADSEPGTFHFVGYGFGQSGDWTVTLPQDLDLKDEFVLIGTSPSARITRVENYPALALWGVAVLGLVAMIGWRVNRIRVVRRGPHLMGYLEVLDENNIPLAGGVKSFPAGVNQHTFSNLPSATGIKKLQVRYLSEDAVEVMVDGIPTTIMHETEWDSGRDFKIKYVNPTLE